MTDESRDSLADPDCRTESTGFDGSLLIYDTADAGCWIQSDTTVDLADAA